jgi:hypothetical protein
LLALDDFEGDEKVDLGFVAAAATAVVPRPDRNDDSSRIIDRGK